MSSFAPSQAELALVQQIFTASDPQKLGIVTGDAAVKVFAGAKLAPTVLGEVWAIADKDNNGFLTRKGVAVALRLIGHAQNGQAVQESLLDKPAPLPFIEGVSKQPPLRSSSPVPRSPPPVLPSNLPPLTTQDKTKFARLFASCGPVNGLLAGDKARDVFIKSKLPFEKLSQIWSLADTQNRGSLDQTDFTIAMYLIQASMSGQLTVLPAILPPALYEQAGGRRPQSVAVHATGSSGSFSPNLSGAFPMSTGSQVQTQYTGQSMQGLRAQTTGQAFKPTLPARPSVSTGAAFSQPAFPSAVSWDVTPEAKANADKLFDGLDPQRRGYIDGDVAVPFMLQSKLSEDILGHVWDLADLNNNGQLTRDGFAVAMHLIQKKLAGQELPAVLPESLVPPSTRGNRPAPAPPMPAFPSEPIRDLLWDDTPPHSASPPVAAPTILPQNTANTMQNLPNMTGQVSQQPIGPFAAAPNSPTQSRATPTANVFGNQFSSAFSTPAPDRNFLDDDDEPAAAAPPLPDNSAEIGNVQNQLNSTNRSLETTKTERQKVEQALANQAGQLSALQTQLSSSKAAYETETRLLSTLRERLTTQTAEMQKTKEDLIRAESDLSAVKVEKAEIEGSFMRDKEEVRDLQRKMKEVGDEVEQVKAAIEKAKKEAKQQKGLLAIARKQLSTRETEKAKVTKELEEAQADEEEATREREAAEKAVAEEEDPTHTNGFAPVPRADSPAFAATQPLPLSPPVLDPISTTSTGSKSNNPFERLALNSGSPSPRGPSPFQALGDMSLVDATKTESHPADDPFFPPDPTTQAPAPVEKSATPKFADLPLNATTSPISPDDSDSIFRTPPTTATVLPSPAHDDANLGLDSPILKTASAQFPPLDAQLPGHFPLMDDFPTQDHDLGGPLKEFDHDSDSDSDDDLEGTKNRQSVLKPQQAEDGSQSTPVPWASPNGTSEHPPAASSTTFDDAFGVTSAVSTLPSVATIKAPTPAQSGTGTPIRSQSPANVSKRSPSPRISAEEVSGRPNGDHAVTPFEPVPAERIPSPTIETVFANAPAEGGLSDFDEAMGKIPESAGAQPQFKFDTVFDDNFDFASQAPQTNDIPVQSAAVPLSAVNGTLSGTKGEHSGFDSVFGTQQESLGKPTSDQQPQLDQVPPIVGKTLSFDDAFGSTPAPDANKSANGHGISMDSAFGSGDGLIKALAFDDAFKVDATTTGRGSPTPKPASPHVTFPASSIPGSPSSIPSSPNATKRSTSPPPRHYSPPPGPPRGSTARPRQSTGSSSDGHVVQEKPAPTTKRSGLSIRLPFGKKDKKKAKNEPAPIVPASSTYLSPVAEPSGAVTPAVEDDVEPVKQLCGMGFSRTQAVTALEKHGYDVQKALNSLLGAP